MRSGTMTFRQSLMAFGDHVLDKALKTVEAGACYPSHGQRCACLVNDQQCPNTKLQQYNYSCYGQCGLPTVICC
jgi:hypothetical protein